MVGSKAVSLLTVNSPVCAVAKKVVVRHAKMAASRGWDMERCARNFSMVLIVNGSRGGRLEEGGARILAAFTRASVSSELKDQGRPWMVCHACTALK